MKKGLIKKDVAYYLNELLIDEMICINCSIEESRLSQRYSSLLPQDIICQQNLRKNIDTLCVCIGKYFILIINNNNHTNINNK